MISTLYLPWFGDRGEDKIQQHPLSEVVASIPFLFEEAGAVTYSFPDMDKNLPSH